jgi:multicomponent Na+:H+ antiporter subunit B
MIKRAIALLLLAAVGTLFASLLVGYSPDEQLNLTGRYYAERTAADIGAANIVTAIIVTYRGLDTLGEVTVLFISAAIVGLVLAQGRVSSNLPTNTPTNTPTSTPTSTPTNTPGAPSQRIPVGELLSTGSRVLTPLILLLGVYVFVNGHLTPGGGFQGGAILASGMLLLLLADPLKHFSHSLIAILESLSGLLFVGIGVLGLLFAGGFLDNRLLPIGTLGELFSAGVIPIIYSLIGLKVGAEFSSMLASLSETEQS